MVNRNTAIIIAHIDADRIRPQIAIAVVVGTDVEKCVSLLSTALREDAPVLLSGAVSLDPDRDREKGAMRDGQCVGPIMLDP